MLALEQHARLALLAHLILGAALVAASTHLVLWMRSYRRQGFARHRAVRRFAWISAGLFAANFALGLLIYPVYKVRVRVEYLDNPAAIAADYRSRLEHRHGGGPIVPPAADDRVRIARWFDVKEHVIALGLPVAFALAIALTAWNPREHGPALGPPLFALALTLAATTWAAALVGALVTSVRAIGG
jgi:hypothetical protein